MTITPSSLLIFATCSLFFLVGSMSFAATEDLGNGFLHHGVATPVSNHRGTVATVDGEGRNVVLVWLYDHTGGYALLMIDAQTGQSQQIPMPFPSGGDCPFASILSSDNKFYTHFNGYFCEFDPAKRAFTFSHKTAKRVAMGMTEDDNGVIWAATYPHSGLLSFNPKTRKFKDYGYVHDENWSQYQRYIAADDTGWIYFGVGNTASQIIAFNPKTGKGTPIVPEKQRYQGSGYVGRDVNGKVYGASKAHWFELYNGKVKPIDKPKMNKKKFIASHQGLFHQSFPDGNTLARCDLINRKLIIKDAKTGKSKELDFDYTSEGAHVMGIAAAPDNTICGGTAFPMRFFSYNPQTDQWINREAHGQWNTVARQGDKFYVGGYGGGFLLEWDPTQPWKNTVKGKADGNPSYLTQSRPTINRPHDLLAHPDGHRLVLAGTPGYGFTGGGLLFWDRRNNNRTLLVHTDILPDHATMSLVALADDKLLGGTTTAPGTGGEKKAKQAELYIMDMNTKKLLWHEPVFPGVQTYDDMRLAPNGLVYGIADRHQFFVFDPDKKKVIRQQGTKAQFGMTNHHQGPRTFLLSPEGQLYMLFEKSIAQVDLDTHKIKLLAKSPVKIGPGGDILNGRIYFGSGSHLYSYQVPGGSGDPGHPGVNSLNQ